MKKLALTIGLVILLVGSVMGGLALHASASAQTLTAWGSTAPGTVTIVGNNWTKAVTVNLYMDVPPQDLTSQVAVATPGSNGVFTATFTVGPTTVGPHTITAVQPNPPNPTLNAIAKFTITNTSQVNTQILAIQQNTNTIDKNTDKIEDMLRDVPAFDTTSGSFNMSGVVGDEEAGILSKLGGGDWEGSTPPRKDFDYHHQIRHVSLTLDTENMTEEDCVEVHVKVDKHETHPPVTDLIDDYGNTYPLLYKILYSSGPLFVSVGEQEQLIPGVVHSFEFDTDHWYIETTVKNSNLVVSWTVTTFAKPEHHDGQTSG